MEVVGGELGDSHDGLFTFLPDDVRPRLVLDFTNQTFFQTGDHLALRVDVLWGGQRYHSYYCRCGRYDKDSFPDSSYFNIITSLVQQISTLFPALCPNIMNYYKCSSFLPVRNRNSQCNLKKCIVGKGSYQSVGKVGGQNKLVHLKRLLYTYSKLIGVGVNWIEQHQFIFIYSIYYVMCQREHAHWVMQFSMTHTNLISFVSSTDKPRNDINKLSTRSRAASYSEISPNTEVSCRK